MKPEAPFSHLSPLCDHHHLQAHGIPLNQPIALESPPTISEPSTLCAPTSANSACFPDHQPPPAQHRPVQPVSATSQSISPGRNTRFLSPYTGNSPFLLDHAASTSVACVVSRFYQHSWYLFPAFGKLSRNDLYVPNVLPCVHKAIMNALRGNAFLPPPPVSICRDRSSQWTNRLSRQHASRRTGQ